MSHTCMLLPVTFLKTCGPHGWQVRVLCLKRTTPRLGVFNLPITKNLKHNNNTKTGIISHIHVIVEESPVEEENTSLVCVTDFTVGEGVFDLINPSYR